MTAGNGIITPAISKKKAPAKPNQQITRGFVLHSKPYRESSALLYVLTEDDGYVSLVAKGVQRKNSPFKSILHPFIPLSLSYQGKSSLKTLVNADALSLALPLVGKRLYLGMYLNEISLRCLRHDEANTTLFAAYLTALSRLAIDDNPEPALRCFELTLLSSMGYLADLQRCAMTGEPISAEKHYCYQAELGIRLAKTSESPTFTGAELYAIAHYEFNNKSALIAAKRFTRIALAPYLGHKPLKSRELFIQLT